MRREHSIARARSSAGSPSWTTTHTSKIELGPVAQLGERTVRIREVRGFDPLQVHQPQRFEVIYSDRFLLIV